MVSNFFKKYSYFIFHLFLIFLFFYFKKKSFAIIFLVILILEYFFILFFFFKKKSIYKNKKHPSPRDLFIEGHPYLPYVTKANFLIKPDQSIQYNKKTTNLIKNPLVIKTNSFGYSNGVAGDLEPFSDGKKNISCLGGSTTGNYILQNEKLFSYPLLLQEELEKIFPQTFQVNNFGQGGYNSQDIMISFLIKILDTKPDIVIIYHGYNDVRSYLVKNFKSDYSNSRVSIEKNLWKLKISSLLNKIPLAFTNKILDKYSIQNSLLNFVGKNEIDFSINEDEGLKTFERNLNIIIDICNTNKIKVILSTFCFNKSLLEQDFFLKIVEKENLLLKEISKKKKVLFLDNYKLMSDEKYFLDSIHFNFLGMKKIASNFSNFISQNKNFLEC